MIHPFVILVLVAGIAANACGKGGFAPGASMLSWLVALPFCFQFDSRAGCEAKWALLGGTTAGAAVCGLMLWAMGYGAQGS